MWNSVYRPPDFAAALEAWRGAPSGTRLVAGGTDLVVEQQRRINPARALIDLSHLRELKYVRRDGEEIALGALATHNDVIASHDLVAAALPLAQACIEVGAPQIRTRATVVGNIVTASPANDTIAPLLALEARAIVASASGERSVPLHEFYAGFRRTVLQPGEIVREVRFRPLDHSRRGTFVKLGLRRAQAISVVNAAVVVTLSNKRVESARIALGCVAPTVVRMPEVERMLEWQELVPETIARVAEAAATAIAPIDDLRGTAGYRRKAVAAVLTRALEALAAGREGDAFPDRPVLLETHVAAPRVVAHDGIVARVNGKERALPSASCTTLLEALRDVDLTGVKEGCAEGECGACTVWLDGQAVMSCLVPAAQADGCDLVTIEGLRGERELHPLQEAYISGGAVQCGFCIPGMLMAGAKLLEERPELSREECQVAISGNLCRCTGYRKIVDAMEEAALARSRPAEVPA